jgi:hypothetical protein
MFFILFSVVLFSCKKTQQKDDPLCPSGYELRENSCVCPENKREAYGVCRELRAGEYYGYTSDCLCLDTIFFYPISKIPVPGGSGRVRLHFQTINKMGYPSNSSIEIIETPVGDSIPLTESWLPYCKIGVTPFAKVITGMIYKDSINLKIYYVLFNGNQIQFIRDSCYIVLRK